MSEFGLTDHITMTCEDWQIDRDFMLANRRQKKQA